MIKGISSQNSNKDSRSSSQYTRNDSPSAQNNSWSNQGDFGSNSMARTQEQMDYHKTTSRNDNLRDLEARLSKSLNNLAGQAQNQRKEIYARTSVSQGTSRRMTNTNPLKRSQFDHHEESGAALRDEILESKILWHENLAKMQMVNDDLRRHIEQQHADQRSWMRDAQRIER